MLEGDESTGTGAFERKKEKAKTADDEGKTKEGGVPFFFFW